MNGGHTHYNSDKATWWTVAGCVNMRKTLPSIHPRGGRKRIRIQEQPKEETTCLPGYLGPPSLPPPTASSGSATSNTNWLAVVPHTLCNI